MRSRVSLFLIVVPALLAACGTTSAVLAPPDYLIADCPVPAVSAATNGQLAQTLNEFRWALAACNDDKAALRAWKSDDLSDTGPRP